MPVATIDARGSQFVITFPFDEELKDKVAAIPKRKWDKDRKEWRAPSGMGQKMHVRNLVKAGDARLTPDAAKLMEGEGVTLTYDGGNTMDVHLSRFGPVSSQIHSLFGTWQAAQEVWEVTLAPHAVIGLAKLINDQKLAPSGPAHAEIARRLPEAQAHLERYRDLGERSAAAAAELEVSGLGGDLREYQKAGVAYALETRRCLIADQMGLGKTITSLATVHAANAYPLVVVVPAIVKYNWQREAQKWLPGKSVEVLSGSTPPMTLPMVLADIYVINYDVLHGWSEWLNALKPKSLIADESHYAKNGKSRRSIHLAKIADNIPRDGIRLLLTGTPVLNRASELISQLSILDRINDLGGSEYFRGRYTIKGGGSRNEIELHRRLRATCYLRREKSEVLKELPEKERSTVLLDVPMGTAYAEVKAEVVTYLKAHKNDPKVGDKTREAKLDLIKAEITKDKLPIVIKWIKDFLESGEKLVVFAYHVAVQEELVKAFPGCAQVRAAGTEKAKKVREADIARFQTDPETRLAVCSIKAAGVGVTLTAASDVAFVEMGWTPADQDQAEDRCHRLGQRDSVTAHYLLARGTEDERIAELIDGKRQVTTAINEGRQARDDESIVNALTRELLAEGAS